MAVAVFVLFVLAVVLIAISRRRKGESEPPKLSEHESIGAYQFRVDDSADGGQGVDPIRSEKHIPSYRIKYRDISGEVNFRDIGPIWKGFIDSFNAHCHLRGEGRTFYYRGIEQIQLLPTGDVISTSALFERVSPGLKPPSTITYDAAWRIACPMMAFLRIVRSNGTRVNDRAAVVAAVRELLGEQAPQEDQMALLLKERTAGANPSYFSGRLTIHERAVCARHLLPVLGNDQPAKERLQQVFI